ncbi:MAG: hypothetical protein PHD73_09575 [Sediminibacterium sp.]|nr:hypothetical protein [Sediminibacterium sp.]
MPDAPLTVPLRTFAVVFTIMHLVAVLGFGFTQIDKFSIIRAKGIIIEDENGRDRILIGSPIPFSKDRIRTDTTLVRQYWAKQFKNPDQYMEWYKKYKNSAEGIVFMNEKGFDVVQVGDNGSLRIGMAKKRGNCFRTRADLAGYSTLTTMAICFGNRTWIA